MKISWNKKLDFVGREVYEVLVPVEDVRHAVDELLKSLTNQVKVDGFRRGKAPANLVIERAGRKSVEDELRKRLHREAFDDLLNHTSAKPLGPPTFRPGDTSPLDLEYPYIFEVEFNKQASSINPKHGRAIPVIGNLSGGPMAISERMYGEVTRPDETSKYLPDEISNALPEKVMAKAKSRVESFKDPSRYISNKEVEAGKTDTVEKVTKTTQPDDLIVTPPHEKLDEKAELPQKSLDDLLPKTDHKPDTTIEAPKESLPGDTKDLEKTIESPSQAPSDLIDSEPKEPVE